MSHAAFALPYFATFLKQDDSEALDHQRKSAEAGNREGIGPGSPIAVNIPRFARCIVNSELIMV
jgi:hypothetical protein